MGILDDAIRDHLELKRKGGTQESDLQRLEDEAFGPPSRPGDAPGAVATAERPEGLTPETGDEPLEPQTGEPDSPVPEASGRPEAAEPVAAAESRDEAEAPAERSEHEVGAAPEGGVVFHDFAAEEGLVGPRAEATPAPPVEREAEREPEQAAGVDEPEPSEPTTPTPEPGDEASLDDTQPHDVEAEFGAARRAPESPPADRIEAEEIELDDDLELHLDEEELETSGSDAPAEPETGGGETPGGPELTVVEEEDVVEEDVEVVEGEVEEPREDSPEDADEEDVLEETPDFLRETPEHDRLWFEQKPPKDFDFDD